MRIPAHFEDLCRRIRDHDDTAAAEFFDRYKSHVRCIVRCQLRDRRVRRTSDSDDLTQQVMYKLLRGIAEGQLAVTNADQLRAILSCVTRRTTMSEIAWHYRACRDARRCVELTDGFDLPNNDAPVEEAVESRDVLESVRGRLTARDRRILDARVSGHSWAELAAEEDTSADALRLRLERALRQAAEHHAPPRHTHTIARLDVCSSGVTTIECCWVLRREQVAVSVRSPFFCRLRC